MTKYCHNCGNELKNNSKICPKCGLKVNKKYTNVNNPDNQIEVKSRMLAGILAIFLGYVGIHNFYLGYNDKGLKQLLIGLVGSLCCGIGLIVSWIWAIIDAINIFSGNVNDAEGNPLGE